MEYIRQMIFSLLTLLLLSVSFSAFGKGDVDSLWITAMNYSKHGKFDESNAIFLNMMDKLPKRGKNAAYSWLVLNAKLTGNYADAYRYLQMMGYSEEQLKSSETLSHIPTSTMIRPENDVKIEYSIDSLFYEGEFKGCEIRIPVEIDGKQEKLLLDNGCAKMCFASESFAKSHSIQPIGVDGTALGVVSNVKMWIGKCDSLKIGQILFRDILFAVIPDNDIDNPVLKVDGLIGANILRLVGELDFDNVERTIVFPWNQQDLESNMIYEEDGLQYLNVEVKGASFSDTLKFQLDLGAAKTSFNDSWYKQNREMIESNCKRKTSVRGGIGGMVNEDYFVMRDLTFTCCCGSYSKEETSISTKEDAFSKMKFGEIGNDFLLSFKSAVLNVQKMYFYVK